jgi:molybdopterin-guanine dinucleotide biosynthesis protein A
MSAQTGIIILAGGEATRLPGKLQLNAAGVPLLLRVYENVRAAGPVYVCANHSFPPDIDLALECPIIIDRWPGGGPLAALYSALEFVQEPIVFVVAGDAPFVTGAVIAELLQYWEAGLEAVVPVNSAGRLEPLCALYDRVRLFHAATQVVQEGSGGVAAAVKRLRSKRVRLFDERVLANINTPADRRAILQL